MICRPMVLVAALCVYASVSAEDLLKPHLSESSNYTNLNQDSDFLHTHYDLDGDDHLSVDEVTKLFVEAEKKKIEKTRAEFKSNATVRENFFSTLKKKGLNPVTKGQITRKDIGLDESTKTDEIADQWELKNLEFSIYDLDGDGVLSEEEFFDFEETHSLEKEVYEGVAKSVQKYTTYFGDLDKNYDHKISKEEATTGKRHPTQLLSREFLFGLCDVNEDGFLDIPEFACYFYPTPETKLKYMVGNIFEIENFEDGKHSEEADGKLSRKEVKTVLGFKQANSLITEKLSHVHMELRR